MVEAMGGLDEAGDTRSGEGVADVGFDAAEGGCGVIGGGLVNGRYPLKIPC